jgi:archaellum component FlaG (FlaF/FlaG flagellin family)
MKKNLIIFAVFFMATFLCVGAVSAAAAGSNTTLKKTISSSTTKNVAMVESTPTIIDQGTYKWTNSKGHKCSLTWKDYKYSSHNVLIKYVYKYQTKYFSGQVKLVNRESQSYSNDIYISASGNMWTKFSPGFLGGNENAVSFATRKNGIYQMNRDGEWLPYLVQPKIAIIPPAVTIKNLQCPPIKYWKIKDTKTIWLYFAPEAWIKAGPGFSTKNVVVKSNTGTRINVSSLTISYFPTSLNQRDNMLKIKLSTPMKNGYKYTITLPAKIHYFIRHLHPDWTYAVLLHHKLGPVGPSDPYLPINNF